MFTRRLNHIGHKPPKIISRISIYKKHTHTKDKNHCISRTWFVCEDETSTQSHTSHLSQWVEQTWKPAKRSSQWLKIQLSHLWHCSSPLSRRHNHRVASRTTSETHLLSEYHSTNILKAVLFLRALSKTKARASGDSAPRHHLKKRTTAHLKQHWSLSPGVDAPRGRFLLTCTSGSRLWAGCDKRWHRALRTGPTRTRLRPPSWLHWYWCAGGRDSFIHSRFLKPWT